LTLTQTIRKATALQALAPSHNLQEAHARIRARIYVQRLNENG